MQFEPTFVDRLYEALKKEKERTGSKLDLELFIDIFYIHSEKSIENMEDDDELLRSLEEGSDDCLMDGLELALSSVIAGSKNLFESYPQNVKENMLMETAASITEVMTLMIHDGDVNPEKLAKYGHHERLSLICDLARRFEYTYADTKAAQDDFEDLVKCFAIRELTKLFT